MTPHVVYCARCATGTPAVWLVTAPGRRETVCGPHLQTSRDWAGQQGAVRVEPVRQPDTLFDLDGCGGGTA